MSLRDSVVLAALGALVGVAALPHAAAAERRAFTHTFEYMTMPDGETELGIDTEQGRSTFDDDAIQRTGFRLAIQHGVTDRWDLSLRHGFRQQTGPAPADVAPLTLSELELRSRYRFSERGELPVDLAVYAGAAKAVGASVYQLEGKLLLARDLGLLTIAAQPIATVELGGDVAEPELQLGWAAGATYEVAPAFKVGAETWGALKQDYQVVEASAGPAVSWAPTSDLWVTVTAGYGLTDDTDTVDVRAVLGLAL